MFKARIASFQYVSSALELVVETSLSEEEAFAYSKASYEARGARSANAHTQACWAVQGWKYFDSFEDALDCVFEAIEKEVRSLRKIGAHESAARLIRLFSEIKP